MLLYILDMTAHLVKWLKASFPNMQNVVNGETSDCVTAFTDIIFNISYYNNNIMNNTNKKALIWNI